MAINDYKVASNWSKSEGVRQVSDSGASHRRATRGALLQVSYNVTFIILSDSDFQAFQTDFDAVRYTRAFDWTPPDSSTTSKFKFAFDSVTFSPSGQFHPVSATLERFHGAR